MTDQKLKESMQIAEELAKEICIAEPSTSILAQKWKEESPELYEEIRKQESLSQEISFHDSIDTKQALEEVSSRLNLPPRRFGKRIIYNRYRSFFLVNPRNGSHMVMDEKQRRNCCRMGCVRTRTSQDFTYRAK